MNNTYAIFTLYKVSFTFQIPSFKRKVIIRMLGARQIITTMRAKPLATFVRLRRTLAKSNSIREWKQDNRKEMAEACKLEAPNEINSPQFCVNNAVVPVDEFEDEDSLEEGEQQLRVPHYTKIAGWDRSNKELKALGKILSTKRARERSDVQVFNFFHLNDNNSRHKSRCWRVCG